MARHACALTVLLLALLVASASHAQFVPPVPKGLRGHTAVGRAEIPLPRANQRWIRATSPNFTIISSASERHTAAIGETLETMAEALRQVHRRFDARFTDTTVFVFERRRDSQPFFDILLNRRGTTAPGAFIVQADGSAAILLDASRTSGTTRTVKHELMHNILASSGTRLPLWLEEGMAEYFSTTEIRGHTVVTGRPIAAHQLVLRARGTLPIEDLVAATRESAIARHILFYPQCWALVDWMMRSGREEFYEFVADVERGMPADDAFRRHYSVGLGTISRSLRLMSLRPSAASTARVDRGAVTIAIAELSTADVMYEFGTFLGRFVSTRRDAEKYHQAALASDARHARATAGLGTLRSYERSYSEALAFLEAATALDPEDPVVQTAFGEALLQNAIGPFAGVVELGSDAQARFRRARALAQAALIRQESPLARAIVGTTYLAEDDPSPGVPFLEQALAARPTRVDFALNLYALYLRAERTADAESLFQTVLMRAGDPQVALAARVVSLRENLTKANRLIAEQRVDEAAAVVRRVAESTTDPAAKAELLTEAERLSGLAEANRQILAYNEAVRAFNRMEHGTALKMLDSLLAVATDSMIRQRAESLRMAVLKRIPGM